ITYYKGCCVLRQLEAWVGPGSFRDGLRGYLRRFKDGNAAGEDLWEAIGASSGVDVAGFASSWTRQEGFPLVSIDAEERGGRTVLRLSQRRFYSRPEAMEEESDQRWAIPLRLRWSDGTQVHTEAVLLDAAEAEHELPGRAEWIHGNADGIGFYRVELSAALVSRLAAHGPSAREMPAPSARSAPSPKSSKRAVSGRSPKGRAPSEPAALVGTTGAGAALDALTPVERQVLLDDQWALVLCGRQPIGTFLDLLSAFHGEKDYVVLEALVGRLDVLVNRVAPKEALPALRAFVGDLLRPAHEELGWGEGPGDDPSRAVARAVLISGLGDLARDEATLRRAAAVADEECRSPASVDANLAAVAVRLAALKGTSSTLDNFVAEYRSRRDRRASPEEQLRYLGALSAFEKPALAKAVLDLTLSDTVPQESMVSLLRPLMARPATAELAWRFLKDRWQEVVSRAGLMQLSRLVEGLGALPLSKKREVESFFAAHPVEEARRALAQALEEM
ncbi:MAG TPA: M1 family metallopeptidase, partial [Vulgatibacter sp.]